MTARTQPARRWPLSAVALAAAVAGALSFGSGIAGADPVAPAPAPAPVASDALAQHTPADPAVPPSPAVSPAAAPPLLALVPATADTLRQHLLARGVQLEAQQAKGFNALDITLPLPTGWTQVPDPNVPDAFVVIANRAGTSLYTSNAQLVVYKLVGDFDMAEAITHGNVETQQLPAWRTTTQALGTFNGFPSSHIEGTFRQNEMTLNTSRRSILATSGKDRYLVLMAVTTAANVMVADAAATDAIITGFKVAAPNQVVGPAAPAAPAPAPAPAPAAPQVPPAQPAPAPVT